MIVATTEPGLLDLARSAAAGTDERLCQSDLYQRLAAIPVGPENPARHLISELLLAQRGQIDRLPYPPSVQLLVTKEFDRMQQAVRQEDDAYFDIGQHRFRSDLRIAAFGRIPVGP